MDQFRVHRSAIAGNTDFTGADLSELRRHLETWIEETEQAMRANQRHADVLMEEPGSSLSQKVRQEIAIFVGHAADRFTRYARELRRVHAETAVIVQPRHIDIVANICDDAERFDRACIRFKNDVLEEELGDAREIIDRIYVNAREIPISYLDLRNLIDQLRTFVDLPMAIPRPSESQASRYILGQRLGEGAVAEVWQAEDTVLRRQVAIKLVRRSAESNEGVNAHARAMARVPSHTNVVAIFDVAPLSEPGTGEPVNGLVMELVEGVAFMDFLRTVRHNVTLACSIGTSILDVVDHYHSHGLVHHDLHSGNVRVNKMCVIKVYDPSCHASGAARSTASREQMMKRDLRDARDLLREVLNHVGADPTEVDKFLLITGNSVGLNALRAAFIAAINSMDS